MTTKQTVMKVNRDTHEKIKAFGKLQTPKLSPPKVVDLAVKLLLETTQPNNQK